MGRFLMLWPDIIQFGRITSDVITASQRNGFHYGWAYTHTMSLFLDVSWGGHIPSGGGLCLAFPPSPQPVRHIFG